MKKLKVATIVGTRPEVIRLSRLIPKLDEHTDHSLIHTGQNFDRQLNDVFFEDLEIRTPDYFLNVDTTTLGSALGGILLKTEEILLDLRPDAVMILGDTNSSLSAVVAERMHIPVYHMEAGNRSFDRNVPEELNRKIVDHVSTFNMPYNEYSLRNLLREGLQPRFICKTGSPMLEVLDHYKSRIVKSDILSRLNLKSNSYFLVSLHRQENVDSLERLSEALESLEGIARRWQLPVIVSTHPRLRRQLGAMKEVSSGLIEFHEPFGFFDYNKLQLEAKCVISDSGSISEESAMLSFPAVNLRNSTERPEALETGSIIMAGIDSSTVLPAISLAILRRQKSETPDGYQSSDFSDKVLRFLFSTAPHAREWSGLR